MLPIGPTMPFGDRTEAHARYRCPMLIPFNNGGQCRGRGSTSRNDDGMSGNSVDSSEAFERIIDLKSFRKHEEGAPAIAVPS